MKPALLPIPPLGSWRRILGRPRWSRCPPDTAHSQRQGQVVAWTRCRCSWRHRGPTGEERGITTHSGTLCIDLTKKTVFSIHFWITPTTFGMNGGRTFLARRSSQLMDAKKGCSCSSTWRHIDITSSAVMCLYVHHRLSVCVFFCVHLPGHCSRLSVWQHLFPAIPLRVSGSLETPHYAPAVEREVCSQTSLLCYGCKMEAERKDREME